MRLAAALAAYIGSIVAANVMAAELGLVPVGFGLIVAAGTYAAGFALLARDFVHRYGGVWWALAGIGAGSVLSWWLSTPQLALASTAAFLIAELADLGVFAPIRARAGFVRAALASNAVSAPLDTWVFLTLSGFGVTAEAFAGQIVGKFFWATVVPLALFLLARRSRRAVAA